MWSWIEPLWEGLLKVLFDEAEKKIEQPSTIEDANTPKSISDPLREQLNDELRHKDGGGK